MTVNSQSLACRWIAVPRSMLVGLASTILVVAAMAVSAGNAAAQTNREPEQSELPAIDRVLGMSDIGVIEQSPLDQQGDPSHNSAFPLSELDLDRIPHSQTLTPAPVIDLSKLVLIPNPATVSWLDEQFEVEIAPINSRISFRQDLLQQLLSDPTSNDNRIRQVQSILSQLRAERDRIAIEHLLLVRQVNGNGTLPTQAASSDVELE